MTQQTDGDGEDTELIGSTVSRHPPSRAPLDVDKMCGVELVEGGRCRQSLACNRHGLSKKRAVAGRSAPLDRLLVGLQREAQQSLPAE